jgi:hypothetical protein
VADSAEGEGIKRKKIIKLHSFSTWDFWIQAITQKMDIRSFFWPKKIGHPSCKIRIYLVIETGHGFIFHQVQKFCFLLHMKAGIPSTDGRDVNRAWLRPSTGHVNFLHCSPFLTQPPPPHMQTNTLLHHHANAQISVMFQRVNVVLFFMTFSRKHLISRENIWVEEWVKYQFPVYIRECK